MDLLQSDATKIRILKQLHRSEELTMNALRNELGAVNFLSVKRACMFLAKLGLVETDSRSVGGRKYVWVRLTDLGSSIAKKL